MELRIVGQHLTEFDGTDVLRSGGDAAAARIKDLDLSTNALTSVVHLTLLSTLVRLSLPNNRLTELPALPRTLAELDVSDNELETLVGVERCPQLVAVRAPHNRLTSLGRRLPQQLHSLNVAHNAITCVAAVSSAHGLARLHLHGNELSAAALAPLGAARCLRHLTLRGNPACRGAGGSLDAVRALIPKLTTFDGGAVTQVPAHRRKQQQRADAEAQQRPHTAPTPRPAPPSAVAVREAELRAREKELLRLLEVEDSEAASLQVRQRQLQEQSTQLSSVASGQQATLRRLRASVGELQEEAHGLRHARETMEGRFRHSRAVDMSSIHGDGSRHA